VVARLVPLLAARGRAFSVAKVIKKLGTRHKNSLFGVFFAVQDVFFAFLFVLWKLSLIFAQKIGKQYFKHQKD